MKRHLVTIMLILLALWRVLQEVLIVMSLTTNYHDWPRFLTALAILCVSYVLPLIGLTLFLLRKRGLSPLWFGLTIFLGAFVIGEPAGFLNNAISSQLGQWFPNSSLLKAWDASIAPPLVEESLKLGLSLLMIYISRTTSSWSALGIGLGVGLGFEISEDYTYVLASLLDKDGSPIQEAINRLDGTLASHWLLTALMTAAVFLLLQKTRRDKLLYAYVAAPLILHMIWNSPFVDTNMPLKIIMIATSWAILVTFIKKMKTYSS